MSNLFFLALAFGGGLIVGWAVLPEPEFVRAFWAKYGWAAHR